MLRKSLLAVPCALAVGLVLPGLASAEGPEIELGESAENFTGTFEPASLTTPTRTVGCTGKSHITGQYTSPTTGTIAIVFTGCKDAGVNCSNGAAEEIKTGTSLFHLIYIKNFVRTPGILITPPTGGLFAEFKCGLLTYKVKGTGVIGHIENACGSSSKEVAVNFTSSAAGVQTYQEIVGSATVYSLGVKINSAAETVGSLDATMTLTTAVARKLNCP